MKRLLLFMLALAACRDPATLVGTAALVSVDSSEVAVDQLRFEATIDGGALFEPVLRPPTEGGPVLGPTTTVRILLRDELAGQQLAVTVFGLSKGAAAGEGRGRLVVERGFERLVAVKLEATQCSGCRDGAGACVAMPSVSACGPVGGACVACDTQLADACTNGGCACGSGSACSLALGADHCEGGQCKCGSGPSCGAGQECVAQTCQCTPSSCRGGCCLGNQCVTMQSPSTCGMGGRACADCGATACNGGVCVTSTCNATTCPNGCCIGAMCVTAQSSLSCGRSGAACESCGAGQCDGGSCTGSCDATSCPTGCCQGGTCMSGTSALACGTGGVACSTCSTTCANQACIDPCGPANCVGCCLSGVCQAGTSATACGVGGRSCASCSAGSTCSADGGVCVSTASCNATNCATGCCDGDTCRMSTTSTCGTGGRACTSCLTPLTNTCGATGQCVCGVGLACSAGEKCVGGACQCDPLTCAGCCDGNTCRPGNQKSRCGVGGVACVNCPMAQQCTAGSCL
ncbi:MAG: hypothetical protein GQE15_35770 [Archangiaceae bacterium]|nr:hypothetical protein [Archangiaceae bacterium]